MESIGTFDAKNRLSELLDRASRGETFVITKRGQPIARIIPDASHSQDRAHAAAERLKTSFRGMLGETSVDELIAMKHEGHRL